MDFPTVIAPQVASPDTHVLSAYLPVPGLGVLPANAFLVRAEEPVLIDAGVMALADQAFAQITSLMDPRDLRWIWLTHVDRDHVGCLPRLLDAAPQARIVTNFLGMGKLGLEMALDPARVYLINPGQTLSVGDRCLHALRPPAFDAPETTAVFDARTRTLFSADCFGAVLPQPFEAAEAIDRATLTEGLCTWAQIDAPWLSWLEASRFLAMLDDVRALSPERILSSHLPPATDMLDSLTGMLDLARKAPPFLGPDQAALLAMVTAA
jgi:glyoxylase-like metal-dependent hydrolase (beta-lactamase superfamily II)